MKTAVVIPNWNSRDTLAKCLDSLLAQSQAAEIIVVDNGSVDGSVEFIKQNYTAVRLLEQPKNLGFAGGVNVGIRQAIELGAQLVALFNNDAVADKAWLKQLVGCLTNQPKAGIATGKLLTMDGQLIDSTGECYTNWGLPFPRGRGEKDARQYDKTTWVFGASGGASLYRVAMLEAIGLFDEDFFAYYEDVDLSFRAQLAGWKVSYVPEAIAYHQIGATSSKLKGFTTYQTLKNLPMIVRKNVPLALLPTVLPRLWLAHFAFFWSAVAHGKGWFALKGWLMALIYLPKNLVQRRSIQKNRKVPVQYIRSILTWDLPPNAHRLRTLRAKWWKSTGRSTK